MTFDGCPGSELRTPAVERFSEEETVTEGLLPAVERSSEIETVTEGLLPAGEETSTVDGTLEPIGTREELTAASDRRFGAASRTMVVEQSSGEDTVTSRMLPAERPSGEVHAFRSRFRDRGLSSC